MNRKQKRPIVEPATPTVADVLRELDTHDGNTNPSNDPLVNEFLTCPQLRAAAACLNAAIAKHHSNQGRSTNVLRTPRGGWLPPVV
jgi:hypothetical protein